MSAPCFYVVGDGCEKARITVGSREERGTEKLRKERKVGERRHPALWVDACRLDIFKNSFFFIYKVSQFEG